MRLGRTLVRACEVADECIGEVDPAVDAAGLQAVEPRPSSALKHERDVLHGNALVAVCYADGSGVVDQLVLRLHGAGVFGHVSWEGEPFGEGLITNSGAEAGRAQRILLFKRQGSVEAIDPVASIILSNSLSAAKAVAESRMVNRRRGDSPLLAGRERRTVVPSFHCSRAAISVALYGNASPTVADNRLLVLSSSGAASRRPRCRALISVRVVVWPLRRLSATAGLVLRGGRVEKPLDSLHHEAALFALKIVQLICLCRCPNRLAMATPRCWTAPRRLGPAGAGEPPTA